MKMKSTQLYREIWRIIPPSYCFFPHVIELMLNALPTSKSMNLLNIFLLLLSFSSQMSIKSSDNLRILWMNSPIINQCLISIQCQLGIEWPLIFVTEVFDYIANFFCPRKISCSDSKILQLWTLLYLVSHSELLRASCMPFSVALDLCVQFN